MTVQMLSHLPGVRVDFYHTAVPHTGPNTYQSWNVRRYDGLMIFKLVIFDDLYLLILLYPYNMFFEKQYVYIYIYWLVVWLPFLAFSHIYWECHHPNRRSHIFQRGGPTTNQMRFFVGWIGFSSMGVPNSWLVFVRDNPI